MIVKNIGVNTGPILALFYSQINMLKVNKQNVHECDQSNQNYVDTGFHRVNSLRKDDKLLNINGSIECLCHIMTELWINLRSYWKHKIAESHHVDWLNNVLLLSAKKLD